MRFEAFNKHINVSRETFDKLSAFCDLVQKWQKTIRLVSDSNPDILWQRHILDSAQLIPIIESLPHQRIVDLGSGAGFPGMILAINGYSVTCVESDQRKAVFLQEAARILECECEVRAERIENIQIKQPDIITSRALASLAQLLDLSHDFLWENVTCLFHKGENYAREIEEAQKTWAFNITMHPSIIERKSLILQLNNVRKS